MRSYLTPNMYIILFYAGSTQGLTQGLEGRFCEGITQLRKILIYLVVVVVVVVVYI
jgi:hypothetical protein